MFGWGQQAQNAQPDQPAAADPPAPQARRPVAPDGTYAARVQQMQDEIKAHRTRPGQNPLNNPPWVGVLPLDPEPAPDNVIEQGPADNLQVMGALGGAGGGLLRSIIRNLDIEPFNQADIDNHNLSLEAYFIACEIVSLRVAGSGQRRQQVILEMFAPWIPEAMIMPQAEARNELIRLIITQARELAQHRWFAEGIAALHLAHPPPGAVPVINQQAHISHIWRDGNWIAGTTVELALELFRDIIRGLDEVQRQKLLYPVLLLLISFSMRGQISSQKLTKIMTNLQPVMPHIVPLLHPGDIVAAWRNFGMYVNDRNAAAIFRRWINYIPQGAVALRVILAQAAGNGLTQIDTIARAYQEHPNFPWPLFVRLYPEEWNHAMVAIRLIGDNPYFGFRHDLGEVRSTRFKRLAWACGQLLIRAGDRALENYRGFQEDRANASQVKDLIDGYLRLVQGVNIDDPITAEEFWMVEANARALNEYAGGLAGRANMGGHAGP
ncbi:putative nucleoprotein [Guangdong red-banded snake chuvirus-like virus]|uniref:Putative nucleoprotein n=1 Tax=Guangdong red-banded snake chuvirus-like virus TaxID=2116490 RepID=A0A2P1GMS7_9VIRU|nr:putative nucleoprotein [Guangdong red-banded snake chuvirus-like virus]AVM87274.1 putative nucleoprotein [Guangdong red-banded snake chuvirus-like virus]